MHQINIHHKLIKISNSQFSEIEQFLALELFEVKDNRLTYCKIHHGLNIPD